MRKTRLFRGLSVILIFFFFVINGLTIGMFASEGFINVALNTPTSKLVKKAGGTQDEPIHFGSEFSVDINNFTQEELNAKNIAAAAFIEEEMEESAVLLKNDNNALPLKADEKSKVSLFGWSATHPYYRSHSGGGGGSGAPKISFVEALESRGFGINPSLVAAYDIAGIQRSASSVGEAPMSVYTTGVKNSFSEYNGAAIVVLSREAGENEDLFVNYNDEGTIQSSLSLTVREKDMLSLVKQYKQDGVFEKIIVILNASNTMEAGWLDEYSVDACLWIGGPGESTGFYGVADLLTGEATPSGKLVNTYSTSSISSPAMQNYGYAGNVLNDIIYAEGIYVGYKYYETRYEDAILNRGNASSTKGAFASSGGWNYSQEVTFPFGHGLSYTSFEQKIKNVKENNDGTMSVNVTVKNTGNVAGKSVIQVYGQTPYDTYEKQNKVEKASIQLVAFEKTGRLNPNQEVTVEVVVDKYFLASYDSNGVKGYYLSGGTTYLAVGNDAHDALNNVLAAKNATGMVDASGRAVSGDKTKVYSWSQAFDKTTFRFSEKGVEVTNQLQKADWNSWDSTNQITYLSRNDWEATWPETFTKTRPANMVVTDRYEKSPSAISANDIRTEVDAGILFADMWGVGLDTVDENGVKIWDKFIDQLSVDELISTTLDVFGISSIERIAFAGSNNRDGIDGVGVNGYIGVNVVAASWNKELLKRRGEFIGEDALFSKINTQWGPGANYHRTPFSGRNFEYFSEDAVLAYELAGSQVKATESKGITVAIKHFATNDQETNRGGSSVFATEQTFREIYLRPFEGAFVKGRATSTMTTNSNIGPYRVGEFNELINNVLHEEWGFYGIIITDAGGGFTTPQEFIAKGGNMFCFVSDKKDRAKKLKDPIIFEDDGEFLNMLKESAKETLYTYAHTNMMNGLTSDYIVVSVTPWWKTAMITVNLVIGTATIGLLGTFVYLAYFKKEQDSHVRGE